MWEIPFLELIMLGASASSDNEDSENKADQITGAELFSRFKEK